MMKRRYNWLREYAKNAPKGRYLEPEKDSTITNTFRGSKYTCVIFDEFADFSSETFKIMTETKTGVVDEEIR